MRKRRIEKISGHLTRLGAVALALSACSSVSSLDPMDPDQLRAVLRERGVDPTVVVYPYKLTDEMRNWAHGAVEGTVTREERLTRLQARLLDPSKTAIMYQWGYTGTAAEVFENRKANCLAFTNLFVGMAREVGVEVYYLGVNDVESYRKEGDLVVVSDHIAVGFGGLKDRVIFDFSETPPDNYHNFSKISDLTAISMFHSNRGAEALQMGKVDEALVWLRLAVEIDPDLPNAWVNYGVGLRRQGDHRRAEEAYRRALALDPRTYSAYQNLASLLRIEKRLEEARAYEEMLVTSPSRNPYTYITLGDLSRIGGRVEEAEKLYRRAIRLNANDAAAYAALGELAVSSGNYRRARKMLKKAQRAEDSEKHPRIRQLEVILESSEDRL